MSRPTPQKIQQAVQQLLREAEAAWGQQDYTKGIELIEQASRKEPANPTLLLELARAHGLRYDFPAAERWLDKAVQVSPTRAQTLGDAGRTCLEFEHVDLAIKFLQRAAEKNGVPIGALMTLADIYIRDKRLHEAAELVKRAAHMDRKDHRVRLEEAALQNLHGETEKAETTFRALLSQPNVSVAVRVRALYDLAAILDRTGRYDEAMSTLLEVKAIQRTHAAPYATTLQHIQIG